MRDGSNITRAKFIRLRQREFTVEVSCFAVEVCCLPLTERRHHHHKATTQLKINFCGAFLSDPNPQSAPISRPLWPKSEPWCIWFYSMNGAATPSFAFFCWGVARICSVQSSHLFLKHASSTFRQSSKPVYGFSMME